MFLRSFSLVSLAVGQIFILGAIGYILVRRNVLTSEGLSILSRLVIGTTLPILIFCQLIRDFKFSLYPAWWIFPLMSMVITCLGLVVGGLFSSFIEGEKKRQFLSLVAFQNSGYLPLSLVATLLNPQDVHSMFIYLFLFLLGFNLVMWSLGVYLLAGEQKKNFELASIFSPPVLATIITLVLVGLGLNKFMPQAILKPLRMVGDSTLPLAMFVVGGSLATIRLNKIDIKPVVLVILGKLLILPLLGLLFVRRFLPEPLLGLLLVMQLAMPSATSLSVITTHYKREDLLISQGILLTHLFSLITIPLFLSFVWIR